MGVGTAELDQLLRGCLKLCSIGGSDQSDETFSFRMKRDRNAASQQRVVRFPPLHADLCFDVRANSQEHHVAWVRDRFLVLRLLLDLLPDVVPGERGQQVVRMLHLDNGQARSR